ncbi:cupin domain-containing protein [Plantactinospora siamensis]|uniref:Cupin domain-containing protein n=1 Tax=Plantactinospora siamensis TaxID=555372 RepID=A0ABV6P438_9ACTN
MDALDLKTPSAPQAMLLSVGPPSTPRPLEVMTTWVDLAPGDLGTPPHRHSGPVLGYVLEGALRFELEGAIPRTIRAGEAFSEPGGDVIHYQAANDLDDAWTRYVVVTIAPSGQPMITPATEAELEARRDRRAPGRLASG